MWNRIQIFLASTQFQIKQETEVSSSATADLNFAELDNDNDLEFDKEFGLQNEGSNF